jgi:hypothetical protein
LEVQGGRGEYVLPTGRPGEQYFLILGSVARTAGPWAVTVTTEAAAGPTRVARAQTETTETWRRHVEAEAERLQRRRQGEQVEADFPPLPAPPAERVFHLFVKDQDFANPGSYVAVTAALRRVGRHCQVYVDRSCADDERLRAAVADAVRTFDGAVYPRARELLGAALDVDRDGRFTILFTPWLRKLQSGKTQLSGFVRSSDFYRDLAAPFGNGCDMMYLNSELEAGPHLRTVLAHEYTHAVITSEHVFAGRPPDSPGVDEECWLNEALAHLVEDTHGFGWSNLDYRVSAFLGDPGGSRLVVPDYYRSGIWRDPGTRGMTYLFLRWCSDQHGLGLMRKLTQSDLRGVDNLEAATREPFEELFRQWSAAVLASGTGLKVEGLTPLCRLDLRRPLGERRLCGPRFTELPLADGRQQVRLAGTGVAYLLLHSPAGPQTRLTVTTDPGADLQVSLLRLPANTARLVLRCEDLGDRRVRLSLTAHGSGVTVDDVVWERLHPDGTPEDTSYCREANPRQTVGEWFGDGFVAKGETRTGPPVLLPPQNERLVVKVSATDAGGHPVAAWADLQRPVPPPR